MSLQNAIKTMRVELGMSQNELAEKLKVSPQSVCRWEQGHNYPKKKIADRILTVASKMDISESCYAEIEDSLQAGRRQGKSAANYGFPDVDQDLLCRIVDESANAVYAIEVDTHRIIYVNKTTEQIGLLKARESITKKCYEHITGRRTKCLTCPLDEISGYEFSEQVIQHCDGKRYLKIRGKKMKWNGKDIFITYVSDVTEEVKSKMAYRNLLDLSPVGMGLYKIYQDGRCELIYINEAFFQMLGITKEESSIREGITKFEAVHPGDRKLLRDAIHNALKVDKVELTYRVRAKDYQYMDIVLKGKRDEVNEEYTIFSCTFTSAAAIDKSKKD